ncbi:MAG: hypothetical protein IPJ77_18310 [Planctomycetes bacterium]|nr:hypothetical protein [Planctomycetota bacterium]
MPRFLVLAVLLFAALLGGVAWWASLRLDGMAAEQRAVARAIESAREPAPRAALERDPAHEPIEAAAEPARARATASDGATYAVEVVERSTGAPVAGARVVAAPRAGFEAFQDRHPLEDAWARFESRGAEDRARPRIGALDGVEVATTDGAGRALLPLPAGEVVLRAAHGELQGRAEALPSTGTTVRIELAPVHAVLVRVTDASGALVAGVPVTLAVRASKVEAHDVLRAFTDERGLARLAVPEFDKRAASTGHGVRLGIVARARGFTPVDLAHPPAEPIELVLPPCGALRLRVERAGAPVVFDRLQVGLAADAKTSGVDGAERGDDWARWPFVEVGLALRADVWAHGFEFEQIELRGPAQAGEELDVLLELSRPLPRLFGRLVDVGRAPVANAELSVRVELSPATKRAVFLYETKTDARGAFELALDRPAEGATGLALRFEPVELAAEGAAVEVAVALPLDADRDLGELVLQAQSVVIDGVLVDETERPVAGAHVLVLPDQKDPRSKGDPAAAKLAARTVRTSAEGRFAVHGTPWPCRARVDVHQEGFASSTGNLFEPGARDVRIVLARPGAVEGSVLLAERVETDWLRLEARRAGGRGTYLATFESDGRFRIERMEPGTYEVRAAWGGDDALASIPGVVVEAGRTRTLAPIDLRAAVRAVRLTVTDEEGASLNGVCAYTEASAGKPQRVGVVGGQALLLARALPLKLVVGAAGYRTRTLEGVDADLTVALARGPRVRIELDPSCSVPAGTVLRASVELAQLPAGLSALKPGQVAAAGTWIGRTIAAGAPVELELTDPGSYRVRWSLASAADAKREEPLDAASARAFEVRDAAEVQVFVVAPRAEDLASAAARLP